MMGEGWSDFYANDLLNAEGTLPDTPAPAEVTIGSYVTGGAGNRAKPEDCPVNPAGIAGCDGTLGAPRPRRLHVRRPLRDGQRAIRTTVVRSGRRRCGTSARRSAACRRSR